MLPLSSILLVCLAINIQYISCGDLIIIPKADQSGQVTASIDAGFVLTCQATGNVHDKPKALQWVTPDGEIVKPDPSQAVHTQLDGDVIRLFFDKLRPRHTGMYRCTGVEASVPTEASITLILQKKITFVETETEQYIKGGESGLVVCRARAEPGPGISWYREGINVNLKNSAKYQLGNDGLTIVNAQSEDEGTYICQASVTQTGEVKRISIKVQVETPPKWVTEPKDTEGVQGQDVVIKCEAHAKPLPVYSWTRNGIMLLGDRYSVNGGTLTIRNLQREDTATYSCIAENKSGRIEAALKLAVLIAPDIALMQNVNVIEGNSAALRCDVREAYPKATIRWKFTETDQFIDDTADGVSITSDINNANQVGGLVGSWSELHFKRASRVDKRNYTCVAENKAAIRERQVELRVEYTPKLILNNEAREFYYSWIFTDNYGNSGNEASQSTRAYPVTFTCLADGEPKPLITWYFQGQSIQIDNIKYKLLKDSEGYAQLEVNPKSINDFGDYQCRAENRLGKEERTIDLREATPPKFAPTIQVKAINPSSIYIDILASNAPESDGGMPIEAYKIEWRYPGSDLKATPFVKEVPLDLTSLESISSQNRDYLNVEIDSLLPDTDYLFRVAAVNKPGVGVFSSKELKIKTSKRRQPDSVKIESREDCQASTRCYVEWSIDSNGGSPIREYLIRYRMISYKDPLNQHVDTDNYGSWSHTVRIKEPKTNYEIEGLAPNSYYEVDILARNDIGPSASKPFRIRTSQFIPGETEQYIKAHRERVNRGVIIATSIIGAIVIFFIIDLICLMKSNCGFLAILRRYCDDDKANSSEYKNKSGPAVIAQHQPKPTQSKVQYQPIQQNEHSDKSVNIPIKD